MLAAPGVARATVPPPPPEEVPSEQPETPSVIAPSPITVPSAVTTLPEGCAGPVEPQIVFVGTVLRVTDSVAVYRVDQVRAGADLGGELGVEYGNDAQFLSAGTQYLVGAQADAQTGVLASKVREEREHSDEGDQDHRDVQPEVFADADEDPRGDLGTIDVQRADRILERGTACRRLVHPEHRIPAEQLALFAHLGCKHAGLRVAFRTDEILLAGREELCVVAVFDAELTTQVRTRAHLVHAIDRDGSGDAQHGADEDDLRLDGSGTTLGQRGDRGRHGDRRRRDHARGLGLLARHLLGRRRRDGGACDAGRGERRDEEQRDQTSAHGSTLVAIRATASRVD